MSLLSLFFGVAMAASLQCPATPYGVPSDNNLHICHKGYYTDYNTNYHIPEFVSWTLTKDMSISCNVRNGSFMQDPEANNQDVPSSEYNNSGYDRGHMANAADFLSDNQEEHESFYMTNILPQNPTNNRGGWKWLETDSRILANTYGSVQIYAGGHVISSNKMKDVTIPDYLWKVVYIPSINKALAIYVPNTKISGKDILNYQTTVQDIETRIGKTLPLPSNYNKSNKDENDWSNVNFGKMLDLKQNSCDIASHVY